MRLVKIPDGLLTNADRTFWLMLPFSGKVEPRIIARGIISIIARISGELSIQPRIDGTPEAEPRIDGKAIFE